MTTRHLNALKLFVLLTATILCARAESVDGRYVYYGNGLSHIMGVAEIEVWSDGENLVAQRPELVSVHCLHGREEESVLPHVRNLVNGNKDTTQRWPYTFEIAAEGMGYKDAALSHCAVEFDLGAETPIDKIEFYRSRYIQDEKPFKLYGDLGWRYLLVLDAERRIVAWEVFNIYPRDWRTRQGRWTFVLQPATGAPAGRLVPYGSLNWLSEAEFIRDFLGKPVLDLVAEPSPEALARQAAYERRNDPAAIEQLGRDFFRVVDLERPSLARVKALVEQDKYPAALEAFKAPFFASIRLLKDIHGTFEYSWMSDSNSRVGMRARDLINGIYADKHDLTVKRFEPGLLPPAKFEHPFQMRPLLLTYASTGDATYLRTWERMTDDWAIGFQAAADEDPDKLRNHFVLIGGAVKDNLLDLVNAAEDRPEFVEELSGATLARFLMPILEEMPVSIWRVCRTCNFNHTYNAIPGAWGLAEVLGDFHAGQRLAREVRQGFVRLYTTGMYRDGSMVEVGDEGHFAATIGSPSDLYGIWAKHGRPAWLNRGIETYFLDAYRANILSHVRNVAPSGVHARWSTNSDQLGALKLEYGFIERWERDRFGGRSYCPELCRPILRESVPRAIVDTVYGQGRPTFDDKAKARHQEHLTEFYGGTYAGPPPIRSDWMPYAGLWYFRGGWEHEAAFLHMVKPAMPNNMGGGILYPITNQYGGNHFPTTSYRFHDYATPLMTGQALEIDGLPPCPHEGRFPSGSKQSVFTRAVEQPQPSRWYTDEHLDFGEAIYRGAYRSVRTVYDHQLRRAVVERSPERIGDVTTWRQIMQIVPARLFLLVERVRFADATATHRLTLPNTMILVQPDEATDVSNEQLFTFPKARRIVTHNPANGSLTVDFFGQRDLSLEINPAELAHGSFRPSTTITHSGYRRTKGKQVIASWEAAGETVLISVMRGALAPAADETTGPDDVVLHETRDLSTDQAAGVEARTPDGTRTTLLVARQPPAVLRAGGIEVTAEALLVTELPDRAATGLVLGATTISVNGTPRMLPATDFQFDLGDGFTTQPIRRPIDPPTIGPATNVFTETTTVTVSSDTPGVALYYLAEPLVHENPDAPVRGMAGATADDAAWIRYTGPFEIDEDTFVRARAVRQGLALDHLPFTADGTDASAISYGFFYQEEERDATGGFFTRTRPGLRYEYLEERWFALWTYTDQLEARATGTTEELLDVSMRQTDGPFAVRYHGYLDVPADGVYTFYAPDEFINNIAAPGYDLRLFIDGEEWDLAQAWHARGTWSVPLEKGLHRFRVTFADARAKDLDTQRVDLWGDYPNPETTWRGTAPVIEISGPKLTRQPIPNDWLNH